MHCPLSYGVKYSNDRTTGVVILFISIFSAKTKSCTNSKHRCTKMIIYAVLLPGNAMCIKTFFFKFMTKGGKKKKKQWNAWKSVYWYSLCSFPLLYPLVSHRKHALNCHRMKPALFSVLCEIKEKTGEFHLFLTVYSSLKTVTWCWDAFATLSLDLIAALNLHPNLLHRIDLRVLFIVEPTLKCF